MDEIEHLLLGGIAVGSDAVAFQCAGRGPARLVEGRDEPSAVSHAVQLLSVHDPSNGPRARTFRARGATNSLGEKNSQIKGVRRLSVGRTWES